MFLKCRGHTVNHLNLETQIYIVYKVFEEKSWLDSVYLKKTEIYQCLVYLKNIETHLKLVYLLEIETQIYTVYHKNGENLYFVCTEKSKEKLYFLVYPDGIETR